MFKPGDKVIFLPDPTWPWTIYMVLGLLENNHMRIAYKDIALDYHRNFFVLFARKMMVW